MNHNQSDPNNNPASRRHPEWLEHQIRWRWLMDSYEGGDRYRQASYGNDSRGLPIRNLVRHKREYPDPREQASNTYGTSYGYGAATVGSDPLIRATDDDYELRRARTPVPTFVREAVDRDIGKVFSRKPNRTIPSTGFEDLHEWTEDVDGRGTTLPEWIEQTVGPVFLTVGHIDILFDHPIAPEGEAIRTQSDADRLGLSRCVASFVLSENVVWWKLKPNGTYKEVVVREYSDPDGDRSRFRYRHWTEQGWTVFDDDGKTLTPFTPHPFGVVPMVRVFDRRKTRAENVGQSRYEAAAERQREYYNRDSELILSDTTQAHPLLQGPEDYVQGDGTIPIGPAWLLPKKKSNSGGSVSYEGFDVVDFPKGAADSIRLNKAEIRDDVDRDCGMTKPAGASGTGRSTVAQSGLSKQMDSIDGNDRLGAISRSLAKLEKTMLRYALMVLRDDPAAAELADDIDVAYPTQFGLSDLAELGDGLTAFQALLAASGESPELEINTLKQMAHKLLPGYPDPVLDLIGEQIRMAVDAKSIVRQQMAEAVSASIPTTPEQAEAAEDENDDDEGGNQLAAPGNTKSGGGLSPGVWPYDRPIPPPMMR